MCVCRAGDDLRLHSHRGYLGNPSLSTFRSPHSALPEHSLLASQPPSSDSPLTSTLNASGGFNTILTSTSPRSYLQATGGGGGHYNRNISFSDDSVTANTTVDRRNRCLQQRALSSPQQEQQRRQSLEREDGPAPPRGILSKDGHLRYTAQPSPRAGQLQATPLSRSLPYRRQLQQQRQSPPLPLPPDVSPLENRTGDDIYGVRGKVVNFSVAGDSYQLTPRRSGSGSVTRLHEAYRQPQQSSGVGGEGEGGARGDRTGQSSLGQAYSMADVDSVLGQSAAGPLDDEDRTTTTSGSYTINADDLCHEIDNLFFNDVVV